MNLPGTTRRLHALLLLALPAGGQATARRNAWAGMSETAVRRRDHRQAEAAVAAAAARAHARRDGTRP